MVKRKLVALAGLASLVYAGVGYAANTVTVDGAIYSLTYSGSALPDADPLNETFRITLGIDTNAYTGGGSFLDNVAIKVSSGGTASLFSAPGGTGNWSLLAGGLNASGCSGSGAGFNCANGGANFGNGVAVTTGNGAGIDYAFTFDVTMANGALFTGLDEASIKARYVNSDNRKVGTLVSENITLSVPEPESYAMLLAGLGLMGLIPRRRKQQDGAA